MGMRSMMNGQVVFGMVTVPIKVYGASEDHDPKLHQVHAADGGKIRYLRTCETCGPDVSIEYAAVGKGYETDKGEVVVLTQEQLEEITPTGDQTIKVAEFVPADQIDPLMFDKSYYIGPGKGAGRPYSVLRAALRRSDRLAVVRVTLRSRESLAVLRVVGQAIVMQTLLWPDEVRKPDDVADLMAVASPDVDDPTVEMALDLIAAMSADFAPERYKDAHVEVLRRLIARLEATGATKTPTPAEAREDASAALMAQLSASVGAAKSE